MMKYNPEKYNPKKECTSCAYMREKKVGMTVKIYCEFGLLKGQTKIKSDCSFYRKRDNFFTNN